MALSVASLCRGETFGNIQELGCVALVKINEFDTIKLDIVTEEQRCKKKCTLIQPLSVQMVNKRAKKGQKKKDVDKWGICRSC